jgi:hypothetical protein
MDYSKSGSVSAAKSTPRPKRSTQKGAPAPKADAKAELLARMKAAAEARKKD